MLFKDGDEIYTILTPGMTVKDGDGYLSLVSTGGPSIKDGDGYYSNP
jgi:hypothetical protein